MTQRHCDYCDQPINFRDEDRMRYCGPACREEAKLEQIDTLTQILGEMLVVVLSPGSTEAAIRHWLSEMVVEEHDLTPWKEIRRG